MGIRQFFGLAELDTHLLATAAEIEVALNQGLKGAAGHILETVKGIPGEYQPGRGPFPPWAPLSEYTKKDRAARGFPPDEPELVTGELRDSYGMEVHGLEASVGSALEKAEEQELGVPGLNLPARPILGMGFLKAEAVAYTICSAIILGILDKAP